MYTQLIHVLMKFNYMMFQIVLFFLNHGIKSPQSSMIGTAFGKPRTNEKLKDANLKAKMAFMVFDISNQWSCQQILAPWSYSVKNWSSNYVTSPCSPSKTGSMLCHSPREDFLHFRRCRDSDARRYLHHKLFLDCCRNKASTS